MNCLTIKRTSDPFSGDLLVPPSIWFWNRPDHRAGFKHGHQQHHNNEAHHNLFWNSYLRWVLLHAILVTGTSWRKNCLRMYHPSSHRFLDSDEMTLPSMILRLGGSSLQGHCPEKFEKSACHMKRCIYWWCARAGLSQNRCEPSQDWQGLMLPPCTSQCPCQKLRRYMWRGPIHKANLSPMSHCKSTIVSTPWGWDTAGANKAVASLVLLQTRE